MLGRPSPLRLFIAGVLLAIGFAAVRSEPVAGQSSDERIVPFTIRVPDAVLADLKARLARPRFAPPLQDGWTHGTDVTYLKNLVTYWRDKFDWRAQEKKLNQFNHFTTTIDGLKIHFIHQKSKQPNAFPLLITHGWPGSFVEFMKVIGPLSDPTAHGGLATDAFDLVIPSIPGYGFSDKPTTPGYDPARVAVMQSKLMARLGYQRYGAQGGDWGAIINTQLALVDSAHMAGLHLNMCIGGPPDPNAKPTERELARQKQRLTFGAEETGYQAIQGTKPQTLGFGLNDSPIGLAAWIVEKFRTWCDCDGNPETIFTKDELLTNITLYWVTETAASSARFSSVEAPDQSGEQQEDRGTDGLRRLPEGDHRGIAQLVGVALQPGAAHRDAQGRALRRLRAAGAVRQRRARVLPDGESGEVQTRNGPSFIPERQDRIDP